MLFIVALLASFILGAASTALFLNRRWRAAVAQAEKELEALTQQYQQHEDENRQLKQTLADTQYQLGSVQKDLNYERSRRLSAPKNEED
ncbi:MAG: hypothetical protein P1U57_02465 [Oleibacter sp.]|nr:hypothetical protein [Thalassolituus sp.]